MDIWSVVWTIAITEGIYVQHKFAFLKMYLSQEYSPYNIKQ